MVSDLHHREQNYRKAEEGAITIAVDSAGYTSGDPNLLVDVTSTHGSKRRKRMRVSRELLIQPLKHLNQCIAGFMKVQGVLRLLGGVEQNSTLVPFL
jgi:hypothetical protein